MGVSQHLCMSPARLSAPLSSLRGLALASFPTSSAKCNVPDPSSLLLKSLTVRSCGWRLSRGRRGAELSTSCIALTHSPSVLGTDAGADSCSVALTAHGGAPNLAVQRACSHVNMPPNSYSGFPITFADQSHACEQNQCMPGLKKSSFDKWWPKEVCSDGSAASPTTISARSSTHRWKAPWQKGPMSGRNGASSRFAVTTWALPCCPSAQSFPFINAVKTIKLCLSF